ncbi:MAG: hypothetical protein WCT26_01175 [Candidatus Buchananbacteria bacterium]|jgi:hypothetical protein
MPENETKDFQAQVSQVIFSWQHQDYVNYHKDKRWYIISVILLLAAVAWSFGQQNYLFGVFLIMFYMVVLLYENRPPEIVDTVITPLGIKSGQKFYYWRLIDHFFVVYRAQGIKNLYIEFKNPISGRLVIPLDGQNAVAIRDYLLKFLNEDLEREAEPITEQLRRFLKL